MIKLCRVRQQIGSGATIQMMGESVFRIHIAKHILMFSSGQSLSQVRLFATLSVCMLTGVSILSGGGKCGCECGRGGGVCVIAAE